MSETFAKVTQINHPLWLWAMQVLGWLIIISSVVLVFVNIPIFYEYVINTNQLPIDSDIIAWIRTLIRRFGELLFFTLAIGIMLRTREPIAILIAMFAASLGAMVGGSYTEIIDQVSLPIFMMSTIVAVLPGMLGILLLFIIPNGQFSPPFGRWLLLLIAVLEPLRVYFSVILESPILGYGMFIPTLLIASIGLWAQIRRYRRGSSVYKQQFKWIIFGGASLITGISLLILSLVLLPQPWWILTQGLDEVGGVILAASMLFAISRYRLYDIDLFINRALVYGSALLGLGLMGVVLFAVLQNILMLIFPAIGQFTALIIAAAVALILLNPTLRWLQHWIDTRIYGLRFDLNQLEAYVTAPSTSAIGAYQGQSIDGYQLMQKIGQGGLCEVYLASKESDLFAVKILLDDKRYNAAALRQFESEATITAQLSHPNVVKMQAYRNLDASECIILHYVDGQTLSDYLHTVGQVSHDNAYPILADVVSALDYIHHESIVHRDLKPSNIIMRDPDKRAILVDFGLAMRLDTADTGKGTIGTITYMSPEQIQEGQAIDHRADIYALGVMTYQLLTGKLPFEGNTGRILFGHLNQPPPDPQKLVETIPLQIAAAIQRAMSKDPADRYPTAKEFLAALANAKSTAQLIAS